MPKTRFERMMFALITVIITVHAYVFYSLYVVNGSVLMEVNQTSGVIDAINKQGGVYIFGQFMPIWVVVIVEFLFAYTLECVAGSPFSFIQRCQFSNGTSLLGNQRADLYCLR